MRLLSVLVLVFSVSAFAGDGEDLPLLELITEINYPHVYYKENSKELTGRGYNLVRAIVDGAHLKSTVSVRPWRRAMRDTKTTPNSCLFVMNPTPARRPQFLWVGPLLKGGWAFYKRSDSDIEINSLEDVKPYLIIGKNKTASMQTLRSLMDVETVNANDDETGAKLLSRGRGQLWLSGIVDGALASRHIKENRPVIAFLWRESVLSMGCNKETDPRIMQALYKAYDALGDFDKDGFSYLK